MAVDLDKPIKRDHTANVKNHGIRRLAATSVSFNGIPSTDKNKGIYKLKTTWVLYNFLLTVW